MQIEVTEAEFQLLCNCVESSVEVMRRVVGNEPTIEDERSDSQYLVELVDLQKKFPESRIGLIG